MKYEHHPICYPLAQPTHIVATDFVIFRQNENASHCN